jgi:hypothetical protein
MTEGQRNRGYGGSKEVTEQGYRRFRKAGRQKYKRTGARESGEYDDSWTDR